MKNRQLLLLVILCSLFISLRTYYYVNQLENTPQKVTNQILQIQSDSIKVDGNALRLTGKIQGKKYLVYQVLKSSEEKAVWKRKAPPNIALISGESENFDQARNLNGFDERNYYRSLGYSQKLSVKAIRPARRKQLALTDIRQRLIWKIDQRYSRRLASYIKALVFGYKDTQFAEYTSVYKSTGLLHLFTLSGLHIQFYLGGVHLFLKRCGLVRQSRLALLIVTGLLLITLTSGSFSTIRAVLSFLIAFACLTFDRPLSKLDQWSVMFFLLNLCFPLAVWSIGAQLSLYFALILLYLADLNLKKWQQTILFSILSIPILLYSFSEWPLAGGIMTLLLLPFFEGLILPGCLLLFFGCFLPLPSFFSNFMDSFFQLLEKLLEWLAFPNWTVGRPNFLFFLILLILVMLMIDRVKYQQKMYGLLAASLIIILSTSYSPNGMVAFIDVGQGDSIFIKLPFKQETFLIDTGGRLNFKQKEWQARQTKQLSDYNLLPFLKSLGCRQIDHLIVTHNDADHMGELAHVLEEVNVENLYLAKGSQWELSNMLESITNTTIHLVKQGDTIGEHLKMKVLSPETSHGENDDSLVTYFTLNQQRFLLTGDLEVSGEEKLLNRYPQLRTDFLKIGHHGSNTSTSEAFLKQLKPDYGIISAGKTNRYGHPTEETLKKMQKYHVKVLRTDQQGMVYYQWSGITKRADIKLLIDFLD